ncbi:RGCVC family protein [Sporichthya sp.]|uniref:RGCVC family protein n=1 Tax=Sporichthya sp. TaxID=65475 RepID=UPI00180BBA58|nr:RGCVC family protein [Sporichthya sp.]MBA3741659.1 hypothetical protein [Sporichthya sp.]
MTTPTSSPTQATDLCHCGHTDTQHDVVAARYCRVTLSEALARPCTCPVGPDVVARSYDRR